MKVYYDLLKEKSVDIDLTFQFEEGDDRYEVNSFKGVISKSGDGYILKGDLLYTLTMKCDRCLEDFEIKGSTVINQKVSNTGIYTHQQDKESLTDDEIDIYITEENYIDIKEFLRDEVLLFTPIKRLCTDECTGIDYKGNK